MLACAVTAKASLVVSGDPHLVKLVQYEGIPIVAPTEAVERLGLMLPASITVVGVDFGAPRPARDQRRKIIAIAAHAVADRRYRVDAIGINERLLAKSPPGWSAKELLDELLTRTVRINAFEMRP